MIQLLMRLLTGRALLLLAVDTNDKDDIKKHIALLERILAGIEAARKLPFGALGEEKPLQLHLHTSEGAIETISRTSHPKLVEILDYLHTDPAAEAMSVRQLEEQVAVSKSWVHLAKQYWALPENREAFAIFRDCEDAGTPF